MCFSKSCLRSKSYELHRLRYQSVKLEFKNCLTEKILKTSLSLNKMDQVFILHKTYERRLEEYWNIFKKFSLYSCNNFTQYWSMYLRPLIKDSGWIALWKLSRKVCEKFKTIFPTIVLVKVLNVDYNNLQCLCEIIAIQTDIPIPDQYVVPLIDLWPTKVQQEVANFTTTVNALDIYRFFITKILMPWDSDNGNIDKWPNKLDSRLKLFYDIKNNVIPVGLVRNVNQYIRDATQLNEEKERLEILINKNTDVDDNEKKLVDIHIQIEHIKTEFKLIEEPFYRGAIAKKTEYGSLSSNENDSKNITYIVHKATKIDEYVIFMNKIKNLELSTNVHLLADINEALELCKSNQTILLNPTEHHITNDLSEFLQDITIKGIDKNDTIISGNHEKAIIDSFGNIHLENLCLKSDSNESVIMLRHTSGTMVNCLFKSFKDGIILLPNSTIELINCQFEDCANAIIGNKNCSIIMKGCNINRANCGINILENCSVKLEDCLFNYCVTGISVDVDSDIEKNWGDFNLLKK